MTDINRLPDTRDVQHINRTVRKPENSTRSMGTQKEDLAETYLRKQGFRIMERNFRSRQGEIDIIGYDDEYLVFAEVKYRKSDSLENPLEAVGYTKMSRICKTADYYRYRKQIPLNTPIRYDVIGILGDKIEWIKNAFPHVY